MNTSCSCQNGHHNPDHHYASMYRSLGEGARKTLQICKEKLAQSKVNLGEAYSKFILGLGHRESHHCQAGRFVLCTMIVWLYQDTQKNAVQFYDRV